MKILFVPQSGALGIGGITRCLSVAQEMSIWGHDIAFLSKPTVRDIANRLDINYYDAIIPPLPIRTGIIPYKLADHIRIRQMDDLHYINASVDRELEVFNNFKPDVVFTEYQFTTAISCKIANIPLLSTVSWHTHPEFIAPQFGTTAYSFDVEINYNKILKKHGLKEIYNISDLLINSSVLNIAPTIPELEPQLKSLPNVLYVGSLLFSGIEVSNFPISIITNNSKNIFVYMSVGELSPDYYIPELIKAFHRKPYNVFVSLRENQYNGLPLPLSIGNIHIHQLLPGISMIRRSDLVITRGGQNTMMSCMLAGVPVIGFPGNNAEPDYNLTVIQNKGAAIKCKDSDFQSESLYVKSIDVIHNNKMKESAEILGKMIRAYKGASAVREWLHNNI